MKVSICIPTHEMNGKGVVYLNHLFDTIKQQTYSDIEVVVSDQSTDDNIKNLCEKWKDDLDLKYIYFDGERKSTVNMNNSVRHTTGEIIKPMMCDDYFYTKQCIEAMVYALENNPEAGWVAVGFGHHFQETGQIGRFMIPSYHDKIYLGNNTMSCPSTVAVKRTEELILFDEKILFRMDCEWYKRVADELGPPLIIEQPSVIMRVHADSVTTNIESNHKENEEELQYIIEKIEGSGTLN
tara:strand:+ start:36 stop:752 length:717 start_codon:yes stop_codon:yes gene_type:complete